MKESIKRLLFAALAALLLLSCVSCYPLRIAKAPDPTDEPKDVFNSPDPIDPADTDSPEGTEPPDVTELPTDTEIPEWTDNPKYSEGPADTDAPQPTETAADTEAPTSAPSADPGVTPGPTPSPTPTPKPTPEPTPTPKPTPTPTPTPEPTQAFNPEFHFSTVDIVNGRTYTQNVFTKAPLTMINVWATWCGPCIGELPYIQQLYGAYYGRVQVLTMLYDSGNGGVPEAIQIMEGMGFTVPCLAYNSSMAGAFGAHLNPPALPTTFFIDNTGHLVKVVKGSHSYSQWVAEIESILNG